MLSASLWRMTSTPTWPDEIDPKARQPGRNRVDCRQRGRPPSEELASGNGELILDPALALGGMASGLSEVGRGDLGGYLVVISFLRGLAPTIIQV
jgi:hypothetical protein